MAKVNPTQFREKHARNLKNSLTDIERGVSNVTVAPTAQAAAKSEKMLKNLTAAVTSGKWADRLKSVDLPTWQEKMINKGIPRISGGIDAAAGKVEDFASQLLPAVDAARNKIKSMPDLTLDDNINRMTAYVRDMAKFKKK